MNSIGNPTHGAVEKLDERQIAARRRLGTASFFFLSFLVLANGILADIIGPWGSPLVQALVLFWVSAGFFTVLSIWHGAYFTGKAGSSPYRILTAVAAAVLLLAVVKKAALGQEIDFGGPGHEGMDLLFLVTGLCFAAVVVAQTLRARRDRREAFTEDELD